MVAEKYVHPPASAPLSHKSRSTSRQQLRTGSVLRPEESHSPESLLARSGEVEI